MDMLPLQKHPRRVDGSHSYYSFTMVLPDGIRFTDRMVIRDNGVNLYSYQDQLIQTIKQYVKDDIRIAI